jgi:PKD repeat protein
VKKTPSVANVGWTNVTTISGPTPRSEAAVAYDPIDGYLVLFGGDSNGIFENDTWTYQNGTWADISATAGSAPSGRYGASLVYDPAAGYLLLVGGEGACSGSWSPWCNDTWSFVHGHWTELGEAPFPNYEGASAVYDSTDGYVLVEQWGDGRATGGTSWSYVNGTFTDVTLNLTSGLPTPAPGYWDPTLSDDPGDGGVVLFGGVYLPNFYGSNQENTSGSTWLYVGGNWTNLSGQLAIAPSSREGSASSYVPQLNAVLLFGGWALARDYSGYALNAVDDTWIFTGGNWSLQAAAPTPVPLGGARMAWDTMVNGSVLFGGSTTGGFDVNQTWVWGSSPPISSLQVSADPNTREVGVPISFTASFHGGVPPLSYDWSFGDGFSSARPTPTHSYSVAGPELVRLWVNDSANHTSFAALNLSVLPTPTAVIHATQDPVDVGISLQFSAAVLGGQAPLSYSWLFGDGNTSHEPSPAHVFGSPGVYQVSVWANDSAGGSANATLTEVVNPALAALVLTENPLAPNLGQLVNFTAIESGGSIPYTFRWDFGDGGMGGNLSTIEHIFTTDGPFVVSLIVSDSGGGQSEGNLTVDIALNLSILGDWSAGAAPLVVSFQSHVGGGAVGYRYDWTFGDGQTSSVPDPTHTFGLPGSYTPELTVTDRAGSVDVAVWDLLVAPEDSGGLTAALTASSSSLAVGSSNLITAFPSGGIGGYAWSWSYSGLDCSIAGLLSLRCLPQANGTYPVQFTVYDGTNQSANATVTLVVGSPITEPPSPMANGPSIFERLGSIGLAIAGFVVFGVVVAAAAAVRRVRQPAKHPVSSPSYEQYRLSIVPAGLNRGSGTSAQKGSPVDGAEPIEDLL